MTSFVVKNNAESTIADNPLAQAATTLNVATGEGSSFPSTFPFLITLWNEPAYPDPTDDSSMEIVKCTGRTVDALTIVRAQEGTADVPHLFGVRIAMLITAGIFNDATYGLATKLDGIEAGADVTDSTNVNAAGAVMESDIKDQSFTNLLENGDFESWSGGVNVAPDGWTLPVGSVVRDTANELIGTYSAAVTRSGSDAFLAVTLLDYERYKNRTMVFGCWVKSAVGINGKLQIYDGTFQQDVAYAGNGAYQFIEVVRTVHNLANQLRVRLYVTTDGTAYFDGAILVEGSVCPAFSPKPLVDDGQSIVIDPATNQVTIDGTVMNGVEAGADVTDATNVNAAGAVMESDIPGQSFQNLLENGDFESWSAGTSAAPDGWTSHGAGMAVARSATHKMGTYSAAVTYGSSTSYIKYTLSDPTRYRSRSMTLGCWVKTATGSQARLQLADSAGNNNSGYHSGSDEWEWITVHRTIDAAATLAVANLVAMGAGTVYFDGAILVEGSVCPAFSPKPMPNPSLITSAPTDTGYNGEVRIYSTGGNRRIYISDGTDWKYVSVAT